MPPDSPELRRGLLARLTATRWRVAWGWLGAVLLIVLARPVPGSIAAGLPLVILGEAVRIVANGSLVKDKALTFRGIYAHLRHPLYVGSALIGAGFLIMARSLILLAVMLVLFLLLYRRTIRREEEKMEQLFGADYLTWAARTPRFFPRRWAPGEIVEHFLFRRAWVNREHQGLLGVIGITVVLYLKYLLLG
jgi:protein-S-isoprenylcysteine O-methyltransferase Ste14